MRIVSWNVNGIRSVASKGLAPCTALADFDCILVQETKGRPEQVAPEIAQPPGWHAFWNPAQRPGYSGVAAFCRQAPEEVVMGLGDPDCDAEGRVITVRFGDIAIVGAYFPNSQDLGARLPFKLAFCSAMERYLASWRQRGIHTVLVGDYNIAHRPIDLARPAENETSPGYLPAERAWMSRYLDLGYRDVFREAHPGQADLYTWWSYRTRARERNVGWRIDYCTVNDALAARVSGCAIHPEIGGSDHCPVSIVVE